MSDNFMNKGGDSDENVHDHKKYQLRRRTSIAVPNSEDPKDKNDIKEMEKLRDKYEADGPKDDFSVQDKGKDKKDKLSKKDSKAKEKAAKAEAKKAGDKPRKLSKIGAKKPETKPKTKPQAKATENKQGSPTNKGGNLKPKPPGPASPKPKVKSPPPKPKPKPKSTPKKPPSKPAKK